MEDVAAGVCAHDDDNNLVRITQETPDIPDMCDRCYDPNNFETQEDGSTKCVCTPHCGSCDPAPVFSDDSSGYMCINLSAYVRAEETGGMPVEGTLIPNTGGMQQGYPYSSSPECSFGRTYRAHKRGMQYDASVANIPNHSVVIVDMDRSEKKCTVNLPDAPRKVVYAPNEPVPRETLITESAAATTTTVSLAVVTLGAILAALA